MKMEFRYYKDFWAALMFIGIGLGAMIVARDYRFGSALNMGPGFFPTMLGGVLVVFGILIMIDGMRNKERIQTRVSLRVLFLLTLALVMFGVLVGTAGFIPALVALIFIAAAADREFKILRVLLLAFILIVASVAVFIWGLKLPYPLIIGF